MSKIFHQLVTGGLKQMCFNIGEIFEHAQEPPDVVNSSIIPPICDEWFLTEK